MVGHDRVSVSLGCRAGRGFGGVAMGVLSVGLIMAGCTSQRVRDNQQAARQRTAEARAETGPTDYVLRAGDAVSVKFFYNPELDAQMPIRPDGRIALALVGEIEAAGLTPAQLSGRLGQRYASVVKHPDATVIVTSFASQVVYVGGEVYRPGVIQASPDLTALQAIMMAGGTRATGEMRTVVIVRDQGTPTPKLLMLDLTRGLDDLEGYEDLVLRPKDIVFVPMSAIARADQFVDQYIEKLVPIARTFNIQYNFGSITP